MLGPRSNAPDVSGVKMTPSALNICSSAARQINPRDLNAREGTEFHVSRRINSRIVDGEHQMRIAQVAPLTEAVPPSLYGGTERVVSWLTEELVALGHDVTLFASGDSVTRQARARLAARAAARWHGARPQRLAHRDDRAGLPPRHKSSTSSISIWTICRSRCCRVNDALGSRRCTAGSICPSISRCSQPSPTFP